MSRRRTMPETPRAAALTARINALMEETKSLRAACTHHHPAINGNVTKLIIVNEGGYPCANCGWHEGHLEYLMCQNCRKEIRPQDENYFVLRAEAAQLRDSAKDYSFLPQGESVSEAEQELYDMPLD